MSLRRISGPRLKASGGALQRVSDQPADTPVTQDRLTSVALAKVDQFTGWLSTYGKQGLIGEVGWPEAEANDNALWQVIGAAVYARAAAADLEVTYYACGEKWSSNFNMSAYKPTVIQSTPLSIARPPAAVIEAHAPRRRGINISGGEFNGPVGAFASDNIGVYGPGNDYFYCTQATCTYLASRGITTVRLGFSWERLQPTLNAALNTTELARLTTVIGYITGAGMNVILDNHMQFGQYWSPGHVPILLGSTELPDTALADLWTRMATAFGANAGVVGYGLVNEPSRMPAGGMVFTNETALSTFDANITGWTVGAASEVWDASHGGSMRVTGNTANIKTQEFDNSLRDRSMGGNGLDWWADIYLDSSATGNWDVTLQTIDSATGLFQRAADGVSDGRMFVRLTKGIVNRVRMHVPLAHAQAMRRVEINWSGAPNTGFAYVQGVWQGTYAQAYTPAQHWEQASQSAITAIRTVDSTTPVYVGNYAQNAEHGYGDTHPTPWITDAHHVYEWHVYFDYPSNGTYTDSYATDLAAIP